MAAIMRFGLFAVLSTTVLATPALAEEEVTDEDDIGTLAS